MTSPHLIAVAGAQVTDRAASTTRTGDIETTDTGKHEMRGRPVPIGGGRQYPVSSR
jgi:hypothetical protein